MSDPDDTTMHTPTGAIGTKVEDEAYCSACNQSFPMDQAVCPNDGARLVKLKASRDPLIGRVFEERYEIRTTLGEGGMGTVYRGWQLSVDREVAIKVVHPSIASDRIAVKRFLREARLSSRLSQPNVVNVYDFGQTHDGILYLVMELLRGRTLAHELEPQRALPLRRVMTIGLQLCDALEAAHSMGIIHRDLKPGNVVILDDPPGRDLVKVLDFGLAKSLVSEASSVVTQTNSILGTPLYMPPEQIEGKPTDQRADLYAFGCMLYQMLTGRPPYLAENANLVLAAHLNAPIPPLPASVPQSLVMTIEKLMAKLPEHRLASAALVRDALQAVVDGGYGAAELSDTTPDIAMPDHRGGKELALARTAPERRLAAVANPVSDASSRLEVPPRRSHGALLVAVLVAVAVAIIVVAITWTSSRSTVSSPGRDLVDAPAAAAIVDAALAAPVDAGIASDAPVAVVVPPDAPRRARPDAGVRHVPRDAAMLHAPRDAAARVVPAIDAGDPNIDFLPTRPPTPTR